MTYIGIDLGTSSVKVIAADQKGRVQASEKENVSVRYPHLGWSEQDPGDWLDKTVLCIDRLVRRIDPAQVRGIAVAGQMHGLVTLDENDEVVRPAILWNDGRSAKEVVYLNETIGIEKLIFATGNIAFAGFTAPKILWMKNNEPALFAKIRKIMLPKDYLLYRLTGRFCTDFSDASGMLLLNVKERRWSGEMLALCGICESQLPRLLESYEAAGTLKSEYSARWGMGRVTFAAGAGDNAAAAIGTGTIGDGACTISVGTSGTVFISTRDYCLDENHALHSFAHADGGYHLMGCILNAATCGKWWIEDILCSESYRAEEEPIQKLGCKRHVAPCGVRAKKHLDIRNAASCA